MQATTIEEVISFLEVIISDCKKKPSRMGYFAALYIMVTRKVKEECDKGPGKSVFEDPERMRRLDVIFANRYLEAYTQFQKGENPSECWKIPLVYNQYWYPIVLQHLFAGMNAHISLDLGIAAVETVREFDQPIEAIQKDFNEINKTLASLVGQVEKELGAIWPFLRVILKALPANLDKQIVNFSMEIARKGAWKFASQLAALEGEAFQKAIAARDTKVAKIAQNVVSPPWWIKIPLLFVKLTEWGSIESQIEVLNGEKGWNPVIHRKRK